MTLLFTVHWSISSIVNPVDNNAIRKDGVSAFTFRNVANRFEGRPKLLIVVKSSALPK